MSRAGPNPGPDGGLLEVSLTDLLARLEFETSVPTDREAAAVAAAIATHRRDRALAAAEDGAENGERVPEWTLDGRMAANGVTHRRRPRNVERGREWQAAARSL